MSSRNTKVIYYDKTFGNIHRVLPLYYLRRYIVYIIKEIIGLVALIADAHDSASCMLALLSLFLCFSCWEKLYENDKGRKDDGGRMTSPHSIIHKHFLGNIS